MSKLLSYERSFNKIALVISKEMFFENGIWIWKRHKTKVNRLIFEMFRTWGRGQHLYYKIFLSSEFPINVLDLGNTLLHNKILVVVNWCCKTHVSKTLHNKISLLETAQ